MYVCLQPMVLLCRDFQAPDMIRIRLTLTWGPLCVNDVSLESIGMVFVVTFNKRKSWGENMAQGGKLLDGMDIPRALPVPHRSNQYHFDI